MAYLKNNLYWKIADMKVNRQMKTARVTIVGFKSKTEADKNISAQYVPSYPKKVVELKGENYPFVNDANPNQTAQAYAKIKLVEPFFKDAEEC